jgi:IPT/TIG domain
MTTVTPYANNLEFYGSNDDWTTSTLIDTIGSNVHEGWNYLDYRDDGALKPAFNSYKFKGSVKGSCRVTEFRLTGVQSIADTSNTFTCTPKLLIGTVSSDLAQVTYTATQTPLLKSILPRFGSVLGGDTITLTGVNLASSATALVTVKFDNRPCSVVSQSST